MVLGTPSLDNSVKTLTRILSAVVVQQQVGVAGGGAGAEAAIDAIAGDA